MGFTSIQIDKAKLDSKIYNNVGLPTVKNVMHMVSTNMISNCPISVSDTSNSENIYEPSVARIKVKSTSRKLRPAIKDNIQIPSEIYKKNQIFSYVLMSYV